VPDPAPLTSTVEIAAPPARVWEVVADLTRMPDFSPELRRLWVVGRRRAPGASLQGATLLGVNRRGAAVWPTTSRVVRWVPEREVAWKTRESGATWSYELAPTATGTQVTARRELPSFTLGTTLLGPLIGGAAGHDRELGEGLRTTLERIREAVEAAATASA
jgi:uncharacterized protein YndB with AHSA1/START domain